MTGHFKFHLDLGMWRAKESNSGSYHAAKSMTLTGCAIAVIMLFGCFIVVVESWFELWRSETMRGPVLQSAFRYSAVIALIAIFVATKD